MLSETPSRQAPRRSTLRWWAGGAALAAVGAVAFVGAFPVGMLRGLAERKLSDAYGAPVSVGAVTRAQGFSFAPDIAVENVTIGQPAWAGKGEFLTVRKASVTVPVWSVLLGRFEVNRVVVDGLSANLVRRADGTSNWGGRKRDAGDDASEGPTLEELVIRDGRFTLRDAKRRLSLAGTVAADNARGLDIAARGSFDGSPATLTAHGAAVTGAKADARWPFRARLDSGKLNVAVTGTMDGPLNTRAMQLDLAAKGNSLKSLDYLIEAGLFGTQPIDLTAKVRHAGRDWFIRDLAGSVGRSRLAGRADVLKRDGRTKVTGAIRASQFDFDDLADDQGLAEAAALKARIGPRVIPNTRINLSKVGPTDVKLNFVADRLLSKNDSVFNSLRGDLIMAGKTVTLANMVAGMDAGQTTGTVRIDHRSGRPKLTVDARWQGATLERMLGSAKDVAGPVRGRLLLTGEGDTVREAMTRASGHIGLASQGGRIKKTVANVLAQDLGKTIGAAISGGNDMVPLHCLVARFQARGGVLSPSPLTIDTAQGIGRGSGRIVLDGETIALTLTGQAREGSGLRITDPLRVGGTFSKPAISVAGLGAAEQAKPKAATVLKVVGRSIKQALGIGPKRAAPAPAPAPAAIDCAGLAAALR